MKSLWVIARIWIPACVGMTLCQSAWAAAEREQYNVGEEVPSFTLKSVNADTANGQLVSLDTYLKARGKDPKKAVLISFFATYCEPCKHEMPYLAALYDEYKDRGFMVLSVSIDKEQDKVDFITALAKKSGVTYPVLWDHYNIVARRYIINKLPCVYLLTTEGKVALVKIGYDDDMSKQLLEQVRNVIGEPQSAPIPERLAKFIGVQKTL